MDSLDAPEFVKLLPTWNRFLRELVVPPLLEPDFDRDGCLTCIENVRRRLREGATAPLRLAFFGPTGVGKSKLFNSLLEEDISPSGFRRPFTRSSLYYLHDHWRALAAGLDSQVLIHSNDRWRDLILIDTPDFDSVEIGNRQEAQRVFAEADAFVFVTDALKYADASTWDYVRRIARVQKHVIFVLNKVCSQEIPQSFQERFTATLGRDGFDTTIEPRDLIVVPEFPIDDATRISHREPSLVRLADRVHALQLEDSEGTRAKLLCGECQSIHETAERLVARIDARQVELAELRGVLHRRRLEAEQRLDSRLASGVTPALREEVYQRILQRLNEVDFLRYPRQLLSAPMRGIRYLVRGWWNGSNEPTDSTALKNPQGSDVTSTETLQVLESELLRYADEVRLDIHALPGLDRLLTREQFLDIRLDHDEIRQLFRKHTTEFGEWVANHAQVTASEITTENKTKFILSQVLFNSILITAQIHSGGLSLMELGLDGVVSPFVAKAIGVAIGQEKVRQFELDAKAEHRQSQSQIFGQALDAFNDFLDRITSGMKELREVAHQMATQSENHEAIVRYFRRQSGVESRV